jgi:hypothetical protein
MSARRVWSETEDRRTLVVGDGKQQDGQRYGPEVPLLGYAIHEAIAVVEQQLDLGIRRWRDEARGIGQACHRQGQGRRMERTGVGRMSSRCLAELGSPPTTAATFSRLAPSRYVKSIIVQEGAR